MSDNYSDERTMQRVESMLSIMFNQPNNQKRPGVCSVCGFSGLVWYRAKDGKHGALRIVELCDAHQSN